MPDIASFKILFTWPFANVTSFKKKKKKIEQVVFYHVEPFGLSWVMSMAGMEDLWAQTFLPFELS